MGPEVGHAKVEPAAGALYTLDVDRSVTKLVSKVHISNGLAWTEDNRTFYYIDSIPRKVFAYNYDLENGSISESPVGRYLLGFGLIAVFALVALGVLVPTVESCGRRN